jgi:PKD repeat protein
MRILLPILLIHIVVVFTCQKGFAQVTITNNGLPITISTNTNVHVNGSYVNDVRVEPALGDPQLIHNGTLYLTGDLTNNSPVNILEPASEGHIVLTGIGNQSIAGSSPFSVFSLTVNKSGIVNLIRNLEIRGALTFASGSINLNGNVISLLNSGSIINETNSNRIFGNGTIIYDLPAGPTGGVTDPLGGLGLGLDGSIFMGTRITRGHSQQSNAGDGSIFRYFDLQQVPGNDLTSIRFYYFDSDIPVGLNESDFAVFISYNGGTTWTNIGGSVNLASNYVDVSGLAINSNVRITLSNKTCGTPPLVNLGPALADFCEGSNVVLNAGNPGLLYTWNTTETSQTINVTAGGAYSVVVRDLNGCEGSDAITLTQRPKPTASFTKGISCPGLPTSLTNSSTILGGGALTYLWDFGDPATTADTSTDQNTFYTYPLAGSYLVSLTATSSFSCSDTRLQSITIDPIPNSDFNVVNSCFGQATLFTNNSNVPSPYGLTYVWDFGDGTNSAVTNPSKSYSATGSFTVTLTSTSNAGCVGTKTKAVIISPTPVANFSITDSCEATLVSLINSTTISSGTLSYNWNFGDGTTSVMTSPSKSFSNSGVYSVNLTAISGLGCSHQITKTVDIYPVPQIAFGVTDDCQDKSFLFNNNSTVSQGSLSYLWDFNNGITSNLMNPSQSFASAGTYAITLTGTTNFGCQKSITQPVQVFPLPVTNFSFEGACQDEAFLFNNSSSVSSGTIAFAWNFGDGTNSTAINPTKNFALSDTFQVSLAAISDKNCTSIIQKNIAVLEIPTLNLGGDITTCGVSLDLNAQNAGATYLWSDASTNQTLSVTQNGTYTVEVTSANGCSIVESVNVTLNGEVVPQLIADQTVCGSIMLDAGYPGSSYTWSTGETSRSINATSSGTYSVTVMDVNSCTGTDEVSLIINPKPIVNLGPDLTVCANEPVVLNAGNTGSQFLWSTNSLEQTIPVLASGVFSVEVTNSFNCTATDEISVTIKPLPNNMLQQNLVACDQTELDSGNTGSTYLWSTGAISQRINVINSGAYSVSVTTPSNCSLTFQSNVTINSSPTVFLGSDQSICFGASVLLDAGMDGDSYIWSNNTREKTVQVTQSGIYWVDVAKANGCVTRDSVVVIVAPEIQNNLIAEYEICANSTRLLDATSSQAVSYQWFSSTRAEGNLATLMVTRPDKYWVISKNLINCTVTDTVNVLTDPTPITARYLVASFVNVGDSVKFVQLSYPDVIRYDWDFADGVTSTESNPVHQYLRPDDFSSSLLVTDPNGCEDSKTKIISVRLLRSLQNEEADSPFVELIGYGLYPNPASETLNITIELSKQSEIFIGLYSLNGRLALSKQISLQDEIIEMDISGVSAGIYILKIIVNKDVRTLRFIKI